MNMLSPKGVRSRTRFLNHVIPADHRPLKPGSYNSKIGNWVMKGKWAGMPIFSLTLEERATCPHSCKQWDNCYGDNMPFAKRYIVDDALFQSLRAQLDLLSRRYKFGFVVRLHILGDFASVEYVKFWENMLLQHPQMRIFGYTAWQPSTHIGGYIAALKHTFHPRFMIRLSGCETEVVTDPADADATGVLCPEQTEKTANCGTCALCWGSSLKITFLEH